MTDIVERLEDAEKAWRDECVAIWLRAALTEIKYLRSDNKMIRDRSPGAV